MNRCILTLALLSGVTPAVSQDDGPASLKMPFGFELTPTLDVGLAHDDNVANTASDQVSSLLLTASPSAQLSGENGAFSLSAQFAMERGNYLDSSEDNYTDTGLDVLANLAIDKRNSIGIGAIVTRAHEARGTGYSQGLGDLLDEPDTYSNRDGFMVYQRGSNSSRAGLELTAGRSSLDYDGGTLTANRDRFFNYGTARFEIRIRPNSTIFSELNLRDINYDFREEGASSLDSRESDFLLGISWENAARTNATLRVGRGRKNFDEELRDDVSSPRWELELGWLPKTYSNFELFSSRSAQESFGGGNYAEVTSHSIRWAHEWTRRLNTDIGYNISEWDYQGSDRFDNLDGFDASIFYQFRRWLSAGAGISHSAQDSDAEVRTFERNITYIQLNISL